MIFIVGLVALPVVGAAIELRLLWREAKKDRSVGGYIAAIGATLASAVTVLMIALDAAHYI